MLDNGLLGQVQTVEFSLLGIDFRLGRVHIFPDVFVLLGVQHAPAEGNDAPRHTVHRKNDAAVIAVQEFAVVRAVAQAGAFQVFFLEALFLGRMCQCVALFERIAQLKFSYDVVAQAAASEIAHAHRHAVDVVVECLREVIACPLVDHKHGFAGRSRGTFRVTEFFVAHFDAIAPPEPLDGFGKGELLVQHDELNHVAAVAATETFAQLLRGRHHERRRLLIVEGAEAFEVGSRPPKGDKIAHHIHNICRR